MVDAEGLELLVAFIDVGVAAGREIAAVDVGSSQRVANASGGIEISVQKFPLFGSRNLGKHLGGGIRERAAR